MSRSLVVSLGLASAAVLALSAAGCGSAASPDDAVTESAQGALLAGPLLTVPEVADLLRGAGFAESVVPVMVCTAQYESSFYEQASNHNANGSTDYGLWQINSIHLGSSGCASTASALYVGATNAKCALEIYKEQGLGAWYGYLAHKATCDAYKLPPSAGDDDDDDDDAGSGGGSGTSSAGQCWSKTLGEYVAENTCIKEEQCIAGHWYYGVSGSSGPDGACLTAR